MEHEKRHDLNARCLNALERFYHKADRTCRILGGVRDFPASLDQRDPGSRTICREHPYNCYLELRRQL
jgi:hypothetical protein